MAVIKIKDFVKHMGLICKKHHYNEQPHCRNCPYDIRFENFYGCALDNLSNDEIAKIVKNETLKFMKEGAE